MEHVITRLIMTLSLHSLAPLSKLNGLWRTHCFYHIIEISASPCGLQVLERQDIEANTVVSTGRSEIEKEGIGQCTYKMIGFHVSSGCSESLYSAIVEADSKEDLTWQLWELVSRKTSAPRVRSDVWEYSSLARQYVRGCMSKCVM